LIKRHRWYATSNEKYQNKPAKITTPYGTKSMKTKVKALYYSILSTSCAGAVLISSHTSAQSLLVANYTPGVIDEVTVGGSVTPYLSGLNYPDAMAYDSFGDLFVANCANDSGNGNIVEYLLNGTHQTVASGIDPKGLTFNSAGDLFETDYHSGNIYEYSNGVQSTFSSGFNAPIALTFNNANDLFVASASGGGSIITEITPTGTKTQFGSGLNGTGCLAFNTAGDLFDADFTSGDVFEFTPNGMGGYTQSTYATGLATPVSMTIDSSGDLFVGDSTGNGSSYVTEIKPGDIQSVVANGFYQPNGIVLMPVPEPSTWALLAMGASAFLIRYRRKV
jgi:hypothetical protein